MLGALGEHVVITAAALAAGFAIALPLGLTGHRWRRARPPILVVTQVIYAIPSLPLFVLLISWSASAGCRSSSA